MPPEPPENTVYKVPEPAFDPLGAQKDVEVGQFYQKTGDVDAAIARYEDAIAHQPGLAKPYLLLGECWEKKDDAAKAAQFYRKYLNVYPNAPDREKIQKRIEKLQSRAAASSSGA